MINAFGPYRVHRQWRILIRTNGEKHGYYKYFSSKLIATKVLNEIHKKWLKDRKVKQEILAVCKTKVCSRCAKRKAINTFSKKRVGRQNVRGRAGRGPRVSFCKPCANRRVRKRRKIQEVNAAERIYSKKWRQQNPERTKRYYHKYRSCAANVALISIRARKRTKDHPDKLLDYHLRSNFGINKKQFDKMLKAQNGVCAICKQQEKTRHSESGKIRRLSVDHDHATKLVRGLLCRDCNHMLGMARDNADCLRSAIRYLQRAHVKNLKHSAREGL